MKTKMAQASDIIALAQKELGYTEYPAGSNKQKYGEAYGLNYQPWCMIFVWWIFREAGASELLYGGNKIAGCTNLMVWAKANGYWVTGNYKPGDLILFNFDSVYDADHVGICESFSGSTVTCIEGNTSLTSDDNGGKVMRRTRNLNVVVGAYRPRYDGADNTAGETAANNKNEGGTCEVTLNQLSKGSKGSSVKALQILLNGYGYSVGSYGVDGDFGSATLSAVKRFQQAKGIGVDGIVGPATWGKLLKG